MFLVFLEKSRNIFYRNSLKPIKSIENTWMIFFRYSNGECAGNGDRYLSPFFIIKHLDQIYNSVYNSSYGKSFYY